MQRIYIHLPLLLVSALSCAVSSFPQGNGQIQGSLADAANQPVRATVLVQRQRTAGSGQFQTSANTDETGSFLVQNLPPGTYTVCVQAPGTVFLDPCKWAVSPPAVVVAAGQTASAGVIPLESGHLIRVRLTDANRLLDSQGNTAASSVQIGVWSPQGLFVPLRVRTKGVRGRNLELAVPFGVTVQLSANSRVYDLTDETNATIDANRGTRIPIQAAPNTPQRVYTFNVTGRRTIPGRP